MFGILAVLTAAATLLSVEGSLVYYRLPAAPLWLRRRKGVQVFLSSTLANGFTLAIFILGQYLIGLEGKPFPLLDVVLMGAAVVPYWLARRQLRAFERRTLGSAATAGTVADDDAAQWAA